MENNKATDDLREKVKNEMRKVAIQKYGLPEYPNWNQRPAWQKVHSAMEEIVKTKARWDTIKKAIDNIVDEYKEYFPNPNMWRGEILRLQRLEKSQNQEVDEELERARRDTMNRTALIKEWQNKVGEQGVKEIEDLWLVDQNCPSFGAGIYRLDFWGRLYLQEPAALNIIKLYEASKKQSDQRERHRECDT